MNIIRLIRPNHNILKITSVNYVTRHPIKFTEVEDRWRKNDNVSRPFQLIYRAPMENTLKYVSGYLTFTSAAITSGGLYYGAFVFDKTKINDPVLLANDVVIASSSIECLVYLGAFVAFHVAVKVLLSKFVIRMYQNGDNYVAIFRRHTSNSIYKHSFHKKDFHKLSPTFVVSWSDARFSLNKKHAILLENHFKTPEHFNSLLYKKGAERTDIDD